MIYIHIPFCENKCAYCDFLSFPPQAFNFVSNRHEVAADYTRALLAELRAAREGDMKNRIIETIYIGGGTPTAIPASFLCDIIKEAKRFEVTSDAEITVEMNPGGRFPLPALRAAGVNRLSIGLQSFQDPLLKKIGRTHTAKDFIETFRAARDAGFDNINVDLMFSLPGQSREDWREGLERLAALRPEHISTYSLTPAEGTPLWDGLESGKITLPDDEADRGMYYDANRILAAAGYVRYEISNFALPGRESKHNVNTWKRRPYRGFGLGAHSYEQSGQGGIRWHNTENMGKYLQTPSLRENIIHLTEKDAMAETMILGLRLTEGIALNQLKAEYGPNVYAAEIAALIANGLLAKKEGRIFLTARGTDLANRVFGAFI
ncbi:MAG: radical SAM family heme chaperone HemW [Defluviitaleaceae bacterium]|nr:radical SAM family heme chaperone HemW [Defluviitaleaceae bacterium]